MTSYDKLEQFQRQLKQYLSGKKEELNDLKDYKGRMLSYETFSEIFKIMSNGMQDVQELKDSKSLTPKFVEEKLKYIAQNMTYYVPNIRHLLASIDDFKIEYDLYTEPLVKEIKELLTSQKQLQEQLDEVIESRQNLLEEQLERDNRQMQAKQQSEVTAANFEQIRNEMRNQFTKVSLHSQQTIEESKKTQDGVQELSNQQSDLFEESFRVLDEKFGLIIKEMKEKHSNQLREQDLSYQLKIKELNRQLDEQKLNSSRFEQMRKEIKLNHQKLSEHSHQVSDQFKDLQTSQRNLLKENFEAFNDNFMGIIADLKDDNASRNTNVNKMYYEEIEELKKQLNDREVTAKSISEGNIRIANELRILLEEKEQLVKQREAQLY